MRSVTLLLALMTLVMMTCAAPDNMGTEFLLCYMNNQQYGSTGPLDLEIYMTTTSNNVVYVNITTPLYSPSYLDQVTVSRAAITKTTLTSNLRGSGTTREEKGVLIQATEEITVYSVNKEKFSTDAFVAFPTDTLGTDYVAVTWPSKAEIMVAATEDCSVSFLFPSTYTTSDISYNGKTYSGGETLTVSLNKYETFHIYSAAGDLTGTRITSNYPITAMSGNYKTAVTDTYTKTSSDHMVEQLAPVETWGKEFISISTPDRNIGDFLKVIAAEDNTEFNIQSYTGSLDANGFLNLNIDSGLSYYINSTKGIMIALFSKTIGTSSTGDGPNGGDPSMSVLVPIPLFNADYTWSTVKTDTGGNFTNYIVVVTKDSYKDNLVLDNVNVTGATWSSVLGKSDYRVTTLNVDPGAHNLYNTDTTAQFLGMAFGNALTNSYAFASGSRLAPINTVCNVTTPIAGDGYDNDCDGSIDEEQCDSTDTDGDGQIDEDCAVGARVDGNWGDWGNWSSCSVTCGYSSSTITRTRECNNPAPANNGLDCVGSGTETQTCTPSTTCPPTTITPLTTTPVPTTTTVAPTTTTAAPTTTTAAPTTTTAAPTTTAAVWGSWSNWGSCSVSCGNGTMMRTRSCTSGSCTGSDTENSVCQVSSYCLPSTYGNLDLNCGSGQFGCAAGVIQCLDIAFRCDGQIDCDDGSDESKYFTGCDATVCSNQSGAGKLSISIVTVCLALLVQFFRKV